MSRWFLVSLGNSSPCNTVWDAENRMCHSVKDKFKLHTENNSKYEELNLTSSSLGDLLCSLLLYCHLNYPVTIMRKEVVNLFQGF